MCIGESLRGAMHREYDETTVQTIVEALIAGYSPQRVFLFGSHVSGTPDADSDIDLLVIKDTEEAFFDRLANARRAVAGSHNGIPLDLLVFTPDELESRLIAGDQFLVEITEQGRLLYAA
jgi:predicted nucleotidyltransferase